MADATERLASDDRAPSSDDVARAAAEASLAIAYELRTANNIAMLELAAREGWGHDADGRTLRTMIVEALDLATIAELIDGRPVPGQEGLVSKVEAGHAVMNAVVAERGRIMSALVQMTLSISNDDLAAVIFDRGE